MSDRAPSGFFDNVVDRTLANLRNVWREIATSTRGVWNAAQRPDHPEGDETQLRQQMESCLDGSGGEVVARARAAELGRTFLGLNPTGRRRFLHILASEFDVDRGEIDRCCTALAKATGAERPAAEAALRTALTPPRVRLLRQFNALPEGVKFLVDRRAELMELTDGEQSMRGLAADLRELLADWFDIGFLELKRISWDSPAALLEKLIAYEAVHEIRGWNDLKNRLEADRRCFAFFHPRMPDEPLIFVEVALVRGMAGNVHTLLDETAPVGDPATADTAIFYSISNCQRGLSGISFGAFLIKRAVDRLAAELPHLTRYATLSPLPGFRAWLEMRVVEEGDDLLTAAERKALEALPGSIEENSLTALLARSHWYEDDAVAQALKAPLLRLAARYLVNEKTPRGRALDGVAHFHLSNGARLERINWMGDRSPKGLQQSAGLMVNYLYRLQDIEENHEAYTGEGRVTASPAITRLLKT